MQVTKIKSLNIWAYILSPLIISLTWLGFNHVDYALDILSHFIFVIFWLVIPSVIYGKIFLKTNQNIYGHFVLGLPIGLFIILTTGWFIFRFHLSDKFSYIPIFIALTAFYFNHKNSSAKLDFQISKPIRIAILLSLSIVLFLHIYFYTSAMPKPDSSGRLGVYYVDLMWNLGNTWAVIRGYPLIDSRGSDLRFYYHIGQSIFQAMSYWTLGSNPIAVHLYIDPIIQLSIFILVVFFGSMFVANESIIFSIVFLTCCYFISPSALKKYHILMHWHLLFHPLTFFFSSVYLSSFLFTLKYFLMINRFSIPYILMACLALFSIKAPLMGIISLFLAFLFSINAVTQKDRLRNLTKTLILVVSVGLICILAMKNLYPDVSGRPVKSIFQIATSQGLNSSNLESYFSKFKLYVEEYYLNFAALPLILSITVGFFTPLKKKIGPNLYAWTLIGVVMILTSSLVNMLWDLGAGRTYPMWYGFFSTFFFIAALVDRWKRIGILSVLTLIVFLYGGYDFLNKFYLTRYSQDKWYRAGRYSEHWDLNATLDVGEIDAMNWIRTTTPHNSILICNRRQILHANMKDIQNTFFVYSAFSGRQMYVEGEDYLFGENRTIAKARWTSVETSYKTGHIHDQILNETKGKPVYLIVSKRVSPASFAHDQRITLAYSNNSVDIYRLN